MKKIYTYILPIGVFLVSIVVTGILYNINQKDIAIKENLQFERITQEVINAIEDRMNIYVAIHNGGVGLFSTSEYVSGLDWKKYINSAVLHKNYIGISGMGYVVHADYDKLPEVLSEIRDKEDPNFDFYPKGVREDYFITKFIEPFEVNRQAYGYDMGSELTSRKAMEQARDLGQPVLSKKVILVQDDMRTPGFLSFVPIYRGDNIPANVIERREQFAGYIYAPYIASYFFESIWANELVGIKDKVYVEVYDSLSLVEENLIYKNNFNDYSFQSGKRNAKTVPINLFNAKWAIKVIASDDFYKDIEQLQPWVILVSGIILSFMITALVLTLTQIHQRAQSLANEMMKEAKAYQQTLEASNLELMNSKKSLEMKIEMRTEEITEYKNNLEREVEERTAELHDKMNEFARMNKMMLGREKQMMVLKEEIKELKRKLYG